MQTLCQRKEAVCSTSGRPASCALLSALSCARAQNSAAGEVRDSRRSPQRTSRLQGRVHSARGEADPRGWRGAGPGASAQAGGAANEAVAQWPAAAAAAGGSSWHAHYHAPLPVVRTRCATYPCLCVLYTSYELNVSPKNGSL